MKIIVSYIGFKISGQPTYWNEKIYTPETTLDYEKIKSSLSEDFNVKIGPRTGLLKKSSIKMTIGELIKMKADGCYVLQDSFDMEKYLNYFGKSKEFVIRLVELK